MSKKNQHYIPKFYLRYFSFENNLKEIGIYNFQNNFFKENVPLKHQCSKNFFYGEDGIIENNLSNIEGQFDSTIKNIITNESLHKSNDDELLILLSFFVLTDMRSLTSVENIKNYPNRINALDEEYSFPSLGHQRSVNIIFSVFPDVIPTVLDLDYKLLKNNSDVAFISSDYPISKYNLLFEKQNKYFTTTGYKWKGLLVFIPISPTLTLVFFDKSTYKIGNKKDTVVSISNSKEVDQLNLLQVLYSNQIVFFNENISKEYVIRLNKISEKYTKPNIPITHKAKLIEANGQEKEIVVNRNNSPDINFNISSIKIHSGFKPSTINPLKMNFRK